MHGHGTHVAGTIAAEGNNAIGVVGVALGARIMALRGLDDAGSGGDAQLADAIVYAADEGADVINASWGGAGTSQTIKDAIDYAQRWARCSSRRPATPTRTRAASIRPTSARR